jgi:hypothetical protein
VTVHKLKQYRGKIGNTALPDDVLRDGLIFDDSAQARRDEAAAKALAHRWNRWLKMKEIIDADWRKNALAELEAVTGEVETGVILARLEAERIADQTADAVTTQKYLEELAAIRDKTWRDRAGQQLAAATQSINKDIRKRDHELLLRLRLRRTRL